VGTGTNGKATIGLDADTSIIRVGGVSGTSQAGALFVNNWQGFHTILLESGLEGEAATIKVGGYWQPGALFVNNERNYPTIRLEGGSIQRWQPPQRQATINVGGHLNPGALFVNNDQGHTTFSLDADTADIHVGGDRQEQPPGDLMVNNEQGQSTIHLSGASGQLRADGDVIFTGAAWCAEDFNIEPPGVEPGTVMVVGEEGVLHACQSAYDKRVAGVVTGGGEDGRGIVLDKQYSQNPRQPLALLGKVHCKVDSQHGSIEVGDLLTTSPTQGYAMKASDPLKAFGAVIGKALRPLQEGQGLIPILIALQ